MKKVKVAHILMIALCLGVYLNIGWHLGTYIHNNVFYTTPQTGGEKFWAGGWEAFSQPEMPMEDRGDLSSKQGLFSIFWPIYVFMVLLTWAGFGLWTAGGAILWCIFAGGLGELVASKHATACSAIAIFVFGVFWYIVHGLSPKTVELCIGILFLFSLLFFLVSLFF